MTLKMKVEDEIDRSVDRWPTFWEILQRLHQEGVYIHPEQLAEFYIRHGLPVDLCYVPAHLREKARRINTHYQGDMARLSDTIEEQFGSIGELFLGYTPSSLN